MGRCGQVGHDVVSRWSFWVWVSDFAAGRDRDRRRLPSQSERIRQVGVWVLLERTGRPIFQPVRPCIGANSAAGGAGHPGAERPDRHLGRAAVDTIAQKKAQLAGRTFFEAASRRNYSTGTTFWNSVTFFTVAAT